MKPIISIIIPIFNEEQTIIPTLKNILTQTYQNFEIIILDDASTDASPIKIRNFIKKHPNIKLICTNGSGFSNAFNTGKKAAQGKYIIFFRSGNLMSQNFLEYTISLAKQNNSDITVSDYLEITELEFISLRFKIPETRKEIITTSTPEQYIRKLSTYKKHNFERTYTLWNKLITKQTLQNITFPIQNFYPEEACIIDILKNANKIISSNQLLIAKANLNEHYLSYCFNYSSIEKIDFIQKLLLIFKQKKDTNAVKNICINLLNTLCEIRKTLLYYYLDIYDLDEQKKIIDLKFNSIYKYLNQKMPEIANSSRYKQIFKRYKKITHVDEFREENYPLYPQPQKYKGFYPDLYTENTALDNYMKNKAPKKVKASLKLGRKMLKLYHYK